MITEPSWVLVAEFPQGVDLSNLRRNLDFSGVAYRIHRTDIAQELWAVDKQQAARAVDIIQQMAAQEAAAPSASQQVSLKAQLLQVPVVAVTLLLAIVGALLVEWQFQWVHWFTFQGYSIVGREIFFDSAGQAFSNGEYWRLVTPIFLHFGLLHIIFNGLWTWELGRRIEGLAGSAHLLGLILLTAVISNIAQYWWSGPSLFGGLSGVVYGLLGYIWIRQKVSPAQLLAIPQGLIVLMLIWLVLCMSGLINLVISGNVANAAHVAGLVSGMLLGGGAGLLRSKP